VAQNLIKPGTLFHYQTADNEEEIIMFVKSKHKQGTVMYFIGEGDTLEIPYTFSHIFLSGNGKEINFVNSSEDPNEPPIGPRNFEIKNCYELKKCQF